MKLFVLSVCLINCFVLAVAPSNFFVFGRDVPRDLQYNNPRRNYNTPEGKQFLCLVLGICSTYPNHGSGQKQTIYPVHEWSQLEFDYENEAMRDDDIQTHTFVPGVPTPIDVDVYYGPNNNKKIFVTNPRFQAGMPATLSTISNKMMNGNPVLTPYPSWSWHRNPTSCQHDRLISVYRVQIDECGRLWVLDTGRFGSSQTCPPQILAFDLETDNILYQYDIPASQYESRSILVTPIVDVRDPEMGCMNTFVYVADCQAYSIIVYDVQHQTSWRIVDKTLYPYPNFGRFNIEGEHFDLMDGVLGMSLAPLKQGEDRRLFYHALSSDTENWVYTSDIRNKSRFIHNPESSPDIFHTYRGKRASQSAAEAIDKNGIAFFGLATETSINCWNTGTQYGSENIDTIAQNSKTLQFTSGMKVIKNRRGVEELWFVTMRFQKVATGTINPQEMNFRIQAGKIDDLVFNTKCRPKMSKRQ